jgi:hypothetical protein
MSALACELSAVTKLAFVADAYVSRDSDMIIVVLKPGLRERLPLHRSTLTFHAVHFSISAVIEAYERDVVEFLAESMLIAEGFMLKSTQRRITRTASFCLN